MPTLFKILCYPLFRRTIFTLYCNKIEHRRFFSLFDKILFCKDTNLDTKISHNIIIDLVRFGEYV